MRRWSSPPRRTRRSPRPDLGRQGPGAPDLETTGESAGFLSNSGDLERRQENRQVLLDRFGHKHNSTVLNHWSRRMVEVMQLRPVDEEGRS